MTFEHQHLHLAEHHIAEIDDHIAAQRTLVNELREQGEDPTEGERLLENLLESQAFAVVHRRLMLDRLQAEND